ncbi:MAG: undecaprenyldiphospho-muramoylpentapeptide beta-N-acetylglucosaminyltransferase [Spirochaetaceae bacterium]|jgi:UDP-N-acetylglucosamine--N-acetylmuramyl-(pentapeptide) pyrophosphoryl-undecaprenol N-acetylglucosamine transferase|nr:undecaprenyldiphospho-muramoylpentapeptide beta-N-acetylglucosaminyltransferase [Spirochaetaceae bacterium]
MSNNTDLKKTAAFTGGGTGGHIYPGLAVAAALKGACGIVWIGSSGKIDRAIVGAAGIKFEQISGGKLRRYFSFQNFIDVFKIIAGFFASLFILKRYKPALLFSKGGFVSVPPVAAAFVLGIPVFTHESDFSPGLATKINSLFAKKIFVSYEETAAFFSKRLSGKIIVSGNPVRQSFYSANPEKGRAFLNIPAGEKILLVLGGSLGAAELNNLVENCIKELTKNFFVVHQTGGGCKSQLQAARYIRLPYINDEMPDILASATLVMGRAGAGTVWECAAAGRPMLLIPLSGAATRGDQVENARFFTEKGAALTLIHPDGAELLNALDSLLDSPEKLSGMAAAAARIGERRGTSIIAERITAQIQGN